MQIVWFVLTSLVAVLVCHTLARTLERRGRSERRKQHRADILTRRQNDLPVDYMVIQELRRTHGSNG